MSGRTVRHVLMSRWGFGASGIKKVCADLGIDPDTDLDTHTLVAVPADTARLLTPEVLAALPALLRVVYYSWIDGTLPKGVAIALETAEQLGAAIEAPDA